MGSLSFNERKGWELCCDYYNKPMDFCCWYDIGRMRAVRYYPETTECSVYEFRAGKWGPTKAIPVLVHDPSFVSSLANKELREHDQVSESSSNTV
jgi:hypothetical protein